MSLTSIPDFLASFNITDKTQEYDIAPIMLAALMVDTGVLGQLPFGEPVYDTTHYWNEIALNQGQVTVDATGYNSAATTVALAAGHGARLRVGALLKRLAANASPELVQVTAIATDTLTVVRGYGSSTAVDNTFAAGVVVDVIAMPLQEGSDIGNDSSVVPGVNSNYTQIFERSIKITRNQMKRRMAAIKDMLAQSIHDRTMEIKRELEKSVIHSIGVNSGSSSAYRSMHGLLKLISNTDATSEAFSYASFNSMVKNLVDNGAADDMSRLVLVAPTKVRQTISTFDSSNRRLLESDTRQGYFVEQLVSDLGVVVDVVTSNYLGTTTPFQTLLIDTSRIKIRPFADDTFKLMAAEDWVDGVKRRILGEYTLELYNGGTVSASNGATSAAAHRVHTNLT